MDLVATSPLDVAAQPKSSASPARSEAKLIHFVRTSTELLCLLAKQRSADAMAQSSADALRVLAAALGGVQHMSDAFAVEAMQMLEQAPFV